MIGQEKDIQVDKMLTPVEKNGTDFGAPPPSSLDIDWDK